jgi:hypothetical protein
MRDSAIDQAGFAEGLEEGRVVQAKEDIIRLARKRFGPPSDAHLAHLNRTTNLGLLRDVIGRVLNATSWQDLLEPRTDVWDRILRMPALRESDTYQAILDEGRMEGKIDQIKAIIFRCGQARLGPPDAAVTTGLQSISDLARLERILDRLFEAKNWDDLLETP